jgi:hypothetical protein
VEIYDVTPSVESRSISFENPTGEKGAGGQAKSNLGVGRKGAPAKTIKPGETIALCDINGPGVIRHMWLTLRASVETLQGIVMRAYWDKQEHPSVEAPIGPFFGVMHGQPRAYQSAAHAVNEKAGMNCWLEMPFVEHAKITISNESPKETPIFYNIDFTLGDALSESSGRLHGTYRRENPTTLKQDFEILPKRAGQGRYIGCVLGIRPLDPDWWGEGEFKVYLDSDEEFPTICGTGVEDLIGQSWGLQNAGFLYGGTSLQVSGLFAIYRWHIKDPIYWKKSIRVTIQQIGYTSESRLFERQDDWSVCSFWYEPIPSKPLHDMPGYSARVKDYLPKEEKPDK